MWLCCCSTSSMLGDVPIYMESPLHQCGVIDIDATVEKNHHNGSAWCPIIMHSVDVTPWPSITPLAREKCSKFCEEVVHIWQ